MPAPALLSATLALGFEQLVQWKYGTAGALGLLLFTVGLKAKSPAVSSVGAILLAVLLTGPAI
ncbi:hypothetical protein [Streptomyces sp. HF10]|uniref:hypothetical protein n=1 Tax=Streptomyces sp. HF10 TaxID=2692233 RepID=UPI0013172544|nr:hypothetical protein [Streptomyces sp. HF10]QHC30160.1 hypothetical protein GR129_16430 [Streptomyces sp. HF10]